jgi:hypothetical protein
MVIHALYRRLVTYLVPGTLVESGSRSSDNRRFSSLLIHPERRVAANIKRLEEVGGVRRHAESDDLVILAELIKLWRCVAAVAVKDEHYSTHARTWATSTRNKKSLQKPALCTLLRSLASSTCLVLRTTDAYSLLLGCMRLVLLEHEQIAVSGQLSAKNLVAAVRKETNDRSSQYGSR